jgi:hypothetical protein
MQPQVLLANQVRESAQWNGTLKRRVWLTSAEIDDARYMLVPQFAKMKHENRLCLYRSTARAITVAADNSSLSGCCRPKSPMCWCQRP